MGRKVLLPGLRKTAVHVQPDNRLFLFGETQQFCSRLRQRKPLAVLLHHLKSVLHLEDEAIIAIDLAAILEDFGVANVVHAANCEDALTALEQTRFDAAILDIKINQGDSRAVAELLLQRGIPFIFYSGSAPAEWAEQIDVPWVSKPAIQEAVLNALRSQIENVAA